MAGGAIILVAGKRKALHGKVGRGTNNEAEYDGVILGLKGAMAAGATTIMVRGDSQLIIRQLEGKFQVKAPNLKGRFLEAKQLLGQFKRVQLEWVRRGDNAAADQAANDALDGTG
jgi:ribonuclease HI